MYTITNQTAQVRYAGNGVTTAFSVTFQFFEASTLRVRTAIGAVTTDEALGSDYMVSGGEGGTGVVTFVTAPPTGTNVIIDLNIPVLQETVDLAPNGPLPAEDVEQGFDRVVTMVKQQRQTLLAVPQMDVTFNPATDDIPVVPPPAAGQVLVGKSDGSGWENSDPVALEFLTLQAAFSVANIADLAALTPRPAVVVVRDAYRGGSFVWVSGNQSAKVTADTAKCIYVAPASDTTGASGAWMRRYFGSVFLSWAEGADPTGVADCTDAFKGAIAASKLGMTASVNVSGGSWRVDVGGINLTNTAIVGNGAPDFAATYGDNGATIRLTSTTTSPFILGQGWSIKGVTFYWPAQDGTAAPTAFPPLFTGTYVAGGDMEDVTILNAYRGFHFQSGTAIGDFNITKCRIYCIDRLFWFEQGAPETINITDCRSSYGLFTPAHTPNTYLRDHTATLGEFCRIDVGASSHPYVDGFNMKGTLVFGYRYGIRVMSGILNVSKIENNWFDAVSTALSVEGTSSFSNSDWTNNYHWSSTVGDTTTDHPTIFFSSTSQLSDLNFKINNFVSSQGDHIQWNALSTRGVSIVGNRFRSWGRRTGGSPATYYAINATDASLNGAIAANKFQPVAGGVSHNRNGIGVGDALDLAIQANEFDDCYVPLRIIAGTKIKSIGNVSRGTLFSSSVVNSAAAGALESYSDSWDKAATGPDGVPTFLVRAVTQTFTGAKTQVVFGTETFDRDANVASDTFTAPITGHYEFTAQLSNTTGVTLADVWALTIEKTGSSTEAVTSTCYVPANAAGAAPIACRAGFALVAGDAVKVYMTRLGGAGNYVSINDANLNVFSGRRGAS
ncbi:MAG: hypothetical protein E6Q76_02150 [Rhizobium sp.]|nr:MAG: hypothetical protein E6Q76_02150 [Rhizobium sp.]